MNHGLPEATIQRLQAIFTRYPQVQKAILYGSRAKGNFRNGSDIDLTLCGGPDLEIGVLYKIMDEIDDLLLPHTVDLSLFHDLGDPELIAHIQRVGIPFYEKAIVSNP